VRERLDALPLVGRQAELLRLDEALDRARECHGSSWLIVGASGVGKTRLLHRLEGLAVGRGFTVQWSHGMRSTATPLFLFLQLLRANHVTAHEWELDPNARRSNAETAARVGLRASRTTNASTRVRKAVDIEWSTPRGHTLHSVDTTILGLVQRLEELSREQPLLLILDDLQWADAESFRALRLISQSIRTLRVMVVAALRNDQFFGWDVSDPRRAELLDGRRAGSIDWLELGPLGTSEGVSLAASVLGPEGPPAEFRERLGDLVSRCGGNPYFIIESAQSAVETGQFVRNRRGWILGSRSRESSEDDLLPAPIPEPIRILLVERFRGLRPEDQRPLIVAARLGMSFEIDAVCAALDEPRSLLTRRLEHLAAQGWPIHRSGHGPGQFEFDHSFLRESVADAVEFPVAPVVMRRAADWLSVNRPEDTLTRARLLLESGSESEAFGVVQRTIVRAISQRATRQVLRLLDWLIQETSIGPRTFRLFVRAGASLRNSLDYEGYPAVAERLLRLNPPELIRWQARFWLIESDARRHLLGTKGEPKGLLEEIARSHRRVPAAFRAQLEILLAVRRMWEETPSLALVHAARTFERLPPRTPSTEKLRLCNTAATCAIIAEKERPAQHWLTIGRNIVMAHHLQDTPASLLLDQIEALFARTGGNTAKARKLYESLIARTRAMEVPFFEAQALIGQAACDIDAFEFDRARGPLVEALSISTRLDIAPVTGPALVDLGWVEFQNGNRESGRRLIERAVRVMERLGYFGGYNLARLGLAFIRTDEGDLEGARRDLSISRQSARLDPLHWKIVWHQARARLEYRAGKLGPARSELQRALSTARQLWNPYSAISILQELASLEEEMGRRERATSLRRELARIARRHRLDPNRDWRGSGYPNANQQMGSQLPKSPPLLPSRAIAQELTMADRILVYLLYQNRRGSGTDPLRQFGPGETESTLATGMGIVRARFARTLRRLETRGWLVRTQRHASGGRRVVFVYSLTPDGRIRAEALSRSHHQ